MRKVCLFVLITIALSACAKKVIINEDINPNDCADKIFSWESGSVDGMEILILRDNDIHQINVAYNPAENCVYSFSHKIDKNENYEYFINKISGRGDIKLLEQPSEKNNYAVVMCIDDYLQAGTSDYKLELIRKKKQK